MTPTTTPPVATGVRLCSDLLRPVSSVALLRLGRTR